MERDTSSPNFKTRLFNRVARFIGAGATYQSISWQEVQDVWHHQAEHLQGYPTSKNDQQTIPNPIDETQEIKKWAVMPQGYSQSAVAYNTFSHQVHVNDTIAERSQLISGPYQIIPETGLSMLRDSEGRLPPLKRAGRRRLLKAERRYQKLENKFGSGELVLTAEAKRYVDDHEDIRKAIDAKYDLETRLSRDKHLLTPEQKQNVNLVTNRYVSEMYRPAQKVVVTTPKRRSNRTKKFTKTEVRKLEPEDGFWF